MSNDRLTRWKDADASDIAAYEVKQDRCALAERRRELEFGEADCVAVCLCDLPPPAVVDAEVLAARQNRLQHGRAVE